MASPALEQFSIGYNTLAYRKFSDVSAMDCPLPIVGQNRQPILEGWLTWVGDGGLWGGANGFFAPMAAVRADVQSSL